MRCSWLDPKGDHLLKNGLQPVRCPEPVVLRPADFWSDGQLAVFELLLDHAGKPFDELAADERARPFMNQIGGLAARAEQIRREGLYPSERAVREAFLRLVVLEPPARQTGDRRLRP